MSFCRSHKIKPQNVLSWEEIVNDVVIEEQMINDEKLSMNDIIGDQINFIIINQMKKILSRKILLKKHKVL